MKVSVKHVFLLRSLFCLTRYIRDASGRRAVAMATGVIDRYYKDGTPEKQVLVVVTSGWSVLCFDHNLKKAMGNKSNHMDPFEELGMTERIAEKHRRNATENLQASEDSGAVNLRHFSVYAFAGWTGVLRWSKKTGVIGKAARYAGSARPNKGIQYTPTKTNYTKLWWIPNVVVAHQRGEVTSYMPDVHGRREPLWQWQLQTEATWSDLPSPSGLTESGKVVPTLKPSSLRIRDNQPMIHAGGDQAQSSYHQEEAYWRL